MEQTRIEARYHNYLLKSNRRLMMLYGFALLLTYPLLLFFGKDLADIHSLAMIGKTLNILLAIVGSVLIPLLMYRHTTSKKSIDVYDSLPLQKESLFRIHFFAGYTILILPLIVSFIVGFIYISLNPEFQLLNEYYRNIFTLSNELLRFVELSISLLTSYSIAAFVKQNCGTSFDALVYSIVVHLTPILTYLAFYSYFDASLLGFTEPFSTNLFLYLTPFPMMFTYFNYVQGFASIPRLLFFIIASLLLYFFGSYLYVNHKSEKAETPFMNKWFFPIVSYVITIVAMILLHATMQYSVISILNEINQFIYPMLLGCIFYLVLDVIAHRGFGHILKAAINFLLIAAIVMGILIPINATQGFGYVTHVPEIENIESISLSIPYPLTELMGCERTVVITDEETIAKIVEYHEFVLEEYSHYKYSTQILEYNIQNIETNTYPFDMQSNYTESITFEYQTNTGNVTRQYNIPTSWTYPLTQLVTSPSFATNRIQMILPDKEDQTLVDVSLSNNFSTQNSINLLSYGFDLNEFITHLEEDLSTMTVKEFYESKEDEYYRTIEFSYEIDTLDKYTYTKPLKIKSCYQSTIQYLEGLGIPLSYDDSDFENIDNIYLLYPSDQDNTYFHMMCNNYSCFYDYSLETEHTYKELSIEMLKDLLPYLHSTTMFEESGFVLVIDGYGSYLISPELSSYIEKLTKDIPNSGTMMSYEFK